MSQSAKLGQSLSFPASPESCHQDGDIGIAGLGCGLVLTHCALPKKMEAFVPVVVRRDDISWHENDRDESPILQGYPHDPILRTRVSSELPNISERLFDLEKGSCLQDPFPHAQSDKLFSDITRFPESHKESIVLQPLPVHVGRQ